MSNELQTRHAYFGPSLRIVYDCIVNDRDGEEIQNIIGTVAYIDGKWRDVHDGIDILLGNLNSDFKEAIGECALIVSEDGDIIRDTRAKAYKIND